MIFLFACTGERPEVEPPTTAEQLLAEMGEPLQHDVYDSTGCGDAVDVTDADGSERPALWIDGEVVDHGVGPTLACVSDWLYYTLLDDVWRAHTVRAWNRKTKERRTLQTEADPRFAAVLSPSRSGRLGFVRWETTRTTEVWLLEDGAVRLVRPRQDGVWYDVVEAGDGLAVTTERQVFLASRQAPETWTPLALPEGGWASAVNGYAEHLVVQTRVANQRALRVYNLATGGVSDVSLGGLSAWTPWLGSWRDAQVPILLGDYGHVHWTAMLTLSPASIDPTPPTESAWTVEHHDDVVPIDVLRGGTELLIVEAYGSYGDTRDPWYDPIYVPILERGGTIARIHPRGGGARGPDWTRAGRQRRRHTFDDVIAGIEWLHGQGIGTPGTTFLRVASAGGLVGGVVANERPELIRGVLSRAPFLDVDRSLHDDTLPFGVADREEWAAPDLPGLAPIPNVKAQDYPAMHVIVGRNDPRVDPSEATRWLDAIEAVRTDDDPIVRRVEDRGHKPADASAHMWDAARQWAFALALLHRQ